MTEITITVLDTRTDAQRNRSIFCKGQPELRLPPQWNEFDIKIGDRLVITCETDGMTGRVRTIRRAD